ncbi:hypothetical protein RHMOL_Rhmol03G0217800 [Rhododendron molle]|uniref:Uncharacterized protein n=1 Tax=Rhododendron molle TaxID=49168 RepID=A0ACC0PIE7_RHOML|nr:hypothetical protein RHMOL_Rhmol03G0217800 [Rhododendron molle]
MLFLQHIENSQKDHAGDQGNPNIKQDSAYNPPKHHFWYLLVVVVVLAGIFLVGHFSNRFYACILFLSRICWWCIEAFGFGMNSPHSVGGCWLHRRWACNVGKWVFCEAMDDVDRLFQCFKCGVSPPQSAARERKATKHKLEQIDPSPTEEVPGFSNTPLSGSPKKRQQPAAYVQFTSTTNYANGFNKRKHFSPVVFYGSPHGVPPKRPAKLLRLLREIQVDLSEQIKLRYKNMNPRFRHHYEVIQEGLPCHLYFDLEFNKRDNTKKDGDEMVDLLITVVFDALSDKYGIQGDHDWIVELDSSTEAKFSRHLIIRLQKTAFKDNSHAGAFIAEICSRINNEKGSDRKFEKLFVSKDTSSADIPSQIFVDTAVYSRNRCFRLPLSSKAGKNSVLLPTGRFKCKNMSEENVFMASLICNMDADCEKLLICKMDLDCVKALQFDTEINSEFQKQSSASHEFMLNSCTSDLSRTYLIGKSPFPTLDVFVESIATIGNVSGGAFFRKLHLLAVRWLEWTLYGKIRSWYWFSEYGMMVYSMSRNRYCERIGREHKSNHVIYIVDLRKAVYYQKCHDPDCRGYRSPSRPIPKDAIPDDTILFNFGSHNVGGSADENLEHQLVQNGQEHKKFYSDESITDSCRKDGWWIEAIRAAEKIENMPRTLDLTETHVKSHLNISSPLIIFLPVFVDLGVFFFHRLGGPSSQFGHHQNCLLISITTSTSKISSMAAAAAPPIFIDASTLRSLLTPGTLIRHLQTSLPTASTATHSPLRHHHQTSPTSSLLLMPSWSLSPSLPYTGVKLVTHHPLNTSSLPSIHASYVLFHSLTGQTLATLDGTELTLHRTASVSALASLYLSRPNSQTLLMVGAGALAPHLIKAHLTVRPSLNRVIIWNRNFDKAKALVDNMKTEAEFTTTRVCFESSKELEAAVGVADIISCATNSESPLVMGAEMKAGAHLDLVGSFKESMRECDDEAVRRGKVFVDNEAAVEEAGELVGAFKRGVIGRSDVIGDLVELVKGEKVGRRDEEEVTVFKSVGSAVVDLVSAQLVYETSIK